MKKYLISMLSLFVFAYAAYADDLAKANKLFDDNLFQQAVEAYQPLLKSKNKDTRYQAELKTVLALTRLYKYDEAAKTIYSFKVPGDNLWKTRYYLVKLNTLNNLGRYDSADLIETTDDPTKFTYKQLVEARKGIYNELWKMRKTLINQPTEESLPYLFSYYMRRAELVLTPTIFDYLIEYWRQNDIQPYGALLEEAYKLKGKDREAASEVWHVKRVVLSASGKEIPAALAYVSGYINNYEAPKEIKPYIFQPKEILAKSYAAWQAGYFYLGQKNYKQAIDIAEYCLQLPLNYFSDSCANIRTQVVNEELFIQNNDFNVPVGKPAPLTVETRNINKFYVNVYELSSKDFEMDNTPYYSRGSKKPAPTKSWTQTPNLDAKDIADKFKAARTLGVSINYSKQYYPETTQLDIPYIKDGLFAVVFSKEQKPQKHDKVLYLNFTDIAATVTAFATTVENKRRDVFNVYTLDAATGNIKPGVQVFSGDNRTFKTNNTGQVRINTTAAMNNRLAVLAKNFGNHSIVSPVYFYPEKKQQYIITLNTDRAIYRPGQEVKVQANVIEHKAPNYTAYSGKKMLNLTLRDRNGRDLSKANIALDTMGTGSHIFTLPKEILLGDFSIRAELDKNHTQWLYSSVEEYKQPEFEVTLEAPQGVLTYNSEVNVEGNAKYYFGSPVAKGKVTYSIRQSYFVPWFCWWWPEFNASRQDAVEGTAKLAKDGTFKINFKPKDDPKSNGRPSRYTLDVYVTDEGGRTINSSKTFTVSGQEKFFAMKMDKGFFRANSKVSTVNVQMVNASEQPLAGSATAQIYEAVLPENYFEKDPYFNPVYTNQTEIKEGALRDSFPVTFTKDGPTAVNIPALEEGYYLLKLTSVDSKGNPNEGKLLFITIDINNPQLQLRESTLLENSTYYPGETAVVIIGSQEIDANKYVEIYHDQYLTEQKTLKKKGIAVLQIPIKLSHQGGLAINWFSINNYKAYQGTAGIEIPYVNKKLNLKIEAPEEALPGSKANWKLTVKDEKGNPVLGQALVTVYDKSLDYYKQHSLNLPNPYTPNSLGYNPISTSFKMDYMFRSYAKMDYGFYEDQAMDAEMDSFAPVMRSVAAMPRAAMAKQSNAVMKTESAMLGGVTADEAGRATGGGAADQPALRTNFAETAFFGPKVLISNGVGKIDFTLPERFTQWAVLAAAFTKDVKTGKTDTSVKTTKDLMIRLEAPRFLREGDRMVLKAILNNNTDMSLPVTVDFNAKLNGTDAAELLGVSLTSTQVSIPANSQQSVSWDVAAPLGTGLFEITTVARAGSLSDGEQKIFPLLPGKQHLAQSKTISLKDGDNTIELEKISGASIDAIHLQIDPTLLMPVLNAMPLLVTSSTETVNSLVNSYLPLAIFNKMYAKYPELREAAKQVKRPTVTAAWSQKDELLVKELSQSPWYSLSQGYKAETAALDIFNANLVEQQYKNTVTNLTKFQNTDGGFTWIKGGKSSVFITLSVLETMSQAYDYGVKIPEDLVKKAIKYVESEMTLDTTPSYENLTTNLYMAYVLSTFPKTWYKTNLSALLSKAGEYDKYLTPLGKIYSAAVYSRLGNDTEAKIYIAMLFDGAKSDPVTGIYWTPEERSWMWYNDNLTQHTAALKVLSEIDPKDERINGLVQWLIFNKKANQWGNTTSAAKAVYALIDVMDKMGSFKQVKVFNIAWGGEEDKIIAKPSDMFDKSFTLSKYDEQATPAFFKADINKSVITPDAGKTTSLNDFASLLTLFTSHTPAKAAPKGLMNVKKEFFLVKDKTAKVLKDGATVEIGDEIQVRLTISTQSQFNFVMLSDPKPAAFEADNLLSGWRWTDTLPRYEEQKDSLTNFFIDWLPQGTYELKYTIRPTASGNYNVGAAVMQSLFAPEFATHSAGFRINVK